MIIIFMLIIIHYTLFVAIIMNIGELLDLYVIIGLCKFFQKVRNIKARDKLVAEVRD